MKVVRKRVKGNQLYIFVTTQVVNPIKENLKNCVIYGEKLD